LRALEEYARMEHEPGLGAEPLRKGGFHTYAGVIPWYQSFGLTVCMLAACWSASRLICIADPRAGDPPFTELLRALQKYRATIMPAVPTVFTSLLSHPGLTEFDLSSLMCCLSGGAPLASGHCRQFEAKTGVVIFEGYGLSETAPVATCNPTTSSKRKIGTVGFPLPGTDVKILDLEKGEQERPLTADGEIAVSGPQVMKGYWNKPEANMSVFREIANERYFLTGDIGHIDEEGYVLITDRKKDMIIVGGFNVYPREIEDILVEHPKIELAAVVGMQDEQSGEAPKAHVQLKPRETATEKEIRAFCKERLASYKCPQKIEFRRSMPISPAGKMQRRNLQDEDGSL
ncbi:MAG: AMP-binding protein, partial [Desulfosalsimonadaceae bacterium]